VKRKQVKILFKLFIIFLIISSFLITYRRFINRKIGFVEYKELENYLNKDCNRIVFSLHQPYIVEKFYIKKPFKRLENTEQIEKQRVKRNVYVFYRLENSNKYSSYIDILEKKAHSVKIIYQKKYDIFLNLKYIPLIKVYKIEKKKL
jgi:hypothetical protein